MTQSGKTRYGLNAESSPHWALVLAGSCASQASAKQRVRSVLNSAGEIDWRSVVQLAEDHGISSLLYRTLAEVGDGIPAEVLAAFRLRYEKNARKSLFLARELMRILDCMDALGMDAIPYKGVALSEAYYGDMALRTSGDMDVFVRKRDVLQARTVVRELGYTTRVSIRREAEGRYIASGYECTFDSAAGKNLLEIQWALQPRFYAVDFDMEGMFARAGEVKVAGRRMKAPSDEDLLLILAVHAAKHVWGRLIWLRDIAQIVKKDDLDWKWVRAEARKLGIERILHISLIMARDSLQAAIPQEMEVAIAADRKAQDLAAKFSATMAAGVSFHENQVSYFRLMMELRERPWDRARFLSRLAFTPGPGEWDAVRLPGALFPFYRVVRMARLMGRFARAR